MSATTILALQSLLIFLQIVNASNELNISTTWRVILAAGVGAFQYFVNHLGNKLKPEEK
jgi:hypothetical protein